MVWRWPRRLGRFLPAPDEHNTDLAAVVDPWASAPGASERVETPVLRLLTEIEASAVAVFARHGLPDRPGHYARSPKGGEWRFLSEALTAEERWSLVNAQREGSGWRFGTLEDLGDHPDSPANVRRAAQMLRSCRRLRLRLGEGGSPTLGEELEAAIRLGARWRDLDASPDAAPSPPPTPVAPLKLSMPDKLPSKRRKPRARS